MSHDSDTYIGAAGPYGKSPDDSRDSNLFTKHRLEWTARPSGRYSEEFVREFYTSYVANLRSQIDRWAAPAIQAHWSRSEYVAFRSISPCLPSTVSIRLEC